MAKRRTRRRRRMLRALQSCMTVLCVLVLVAGSVYFVNEKLERDRVKSTNADLAAQFHAAEQAAQPEATVAPVVEVTPTPEAEQSEAVALVRKPRQNPAAARDTFPLPPHGFWHRVSVGNILRGQIRLRSRAFCAASLAFEDAIDLSRIIFASAGLSSR